MFSISIAVILTGEKWSLSMPIFMNRILDKSAISEHYHK